MIAHTHTQQTQPTTLAHYICAVSDSLELLGFDGMIENAYDAVSGADYAGEAASVAQLAAINLGRFVQDLLLWCTQEYGALIVAASYVQISSIMPQKRNPVFPFQD